MQSQTSQLINKHHVHAPEFFVEYLLMGAVSGVTAETIVAPLDRAKLIVVLTTPDFKYKVKITHFMSLFTKNVFEALRVTTKEFGWRSMWKGHTATVIRVIPYSGIQFYSHERMRYFLQPDDDADIDEVLPPLRRVLAGSVAGLVAVGITYPLDFIRTRMAITICENYTSVYKVMKKIYMEEGVKTYYKGLVPSLFGIVPYAGASFSTFETLKKYYIDQFAATHEHFPRYHLTTNENMLCGAVSGLVGQTISYPFDVVRRILQTEPTLHKSPKFRTMYSISKNVWKNSGIYGFFRGISINWIKGPISASTSFAVFEYLKEAFYHYEHYID